MRGLPPAWAAIPPLFIYFVLGKFFVQGITAGAIKG